MIRMGPRFPEVHVTLRTDNRWAVASAIRQALRRAGTDRAEIDRFVAEAMAAIAVNDPEPFQRVCRRWVEFEPATH
jgi:hypothetical protein